MTDISERQIREYIYKGDLNARKVPPGHYAFELSAIERVKEIHWDRQERLSRLAFNLYEWAKRQRYQSGKAVIHDQEPWWMLSRRKAKVDRW